MLQYLPWRQFARESLRGGFLPLWNPHQFCGTPFIANYQSAVFYPPNLLFWILPAAWAFGFAALGHLFLAGAFAYLYLRGRGLGRFAACVGGSAFELCGFVVAWLELPTAVNVMVWLPLALHLYERSRAEGGALRGLPTTILLAMMLGRPPAVRVLCAARLCLYALCHALLGVNRLVRVCPAGRRLWRCLPRGVPLAGEPDRRGPGSDARLRLSHRAGGSLPPRMHRAIGTRRSSGRPWCWRSRFLWQPGAWRFLGPQTGRVRGMSGAPASPRGSRRSASCIPSPGARLAALPAGGARHGLLSGLASWPWRIISDSAR